MSNVLTANTLMPASAKYPLYQDGPVVDAPGESWAGLDSSLRYGKRGLPGGLSLAKLLAQAGRKKHRHQVRENQNAHHVQQHPR